MKPAPTDLDILNAIYNRYYKTFEEFDKETNKTRGNKIHVPVDIHVLSEELDMDSDMLFGRLYYHMQGKYGYSDENRGNVPFFSMRVGGDMHCVNFPFVGAILADMRDEDRKYRIATYMAIISMIISIISFLMSIFL